MNSSRTFRRMQGLRTFILPLAATLTVASCASIPHLSGQSRELWAFTAPWDPASDLSARRNANKLAVIISGWIALDSATARPLELFSDSLRTTGGSRYYALVTSWHNDRFHPEVILALGKNETLLGQTAGTIAMRASASGYTGLVLDFEGHAKRDLPTLLRVSKVIADSARARKVSSIAIAIPAGDTAGYPAMPMLGFADFVMPMLYDEHWSGSPPGPVASPDWVRRTLGVRVAEVGANRIVAALPLYGYRWGRDKPGETIGYLDAQRLAAEAGTILDREPSSQTIRARREGQWELWVTDERLLSTLMKDIEGQGVHRFAFWRLGLEDPAVWKGAFR